MKTRLFLLPFATLAFAAGPVSAGLDFTLQHKAVQADAIAVDKPYITDGPSKIYLQYQGNWRVVDSADALEFTPAGTTAQVHLGRYKGAEMSIDETGARTLLRQVVARLPAGATNVTALPASYNPLPIFGWADLEVAVRYDFYGQTMHLSTMYVRMMPGRLVEFSVTALESEYNQLYRPARAILGSWFEPSRDLPPDLAQKYEDESAPK